MLFFSRRPPPPPFFSRHLVFSSHRTGASDGPVSHPARRLRRDDGGIPPGRIAAEFSRRPSSGSFVVITGGCVEPAGGAIPRRLLTVPPFLSPSPPLVPYSPSRGGCALSIPLGETPRRLHQPVNIVIVYDIVNVNELARRDLRPSSAVCFDVRRCPCVRWIHAGI